MYIRSSDWFALVRKGFSGMDWIVYHAVAVTRDAIGHNLMAQLI